MQLGLLEHDCYSILSFFFTLRCCGIKAEFFMLRRRRIRHRPAAAIAAALHASFQVLQARKKKRQAYSRTDEVDEA
jgi:hypothetical protein